MSALSRRIGALLLAAAAVAALATPAGASHEQPRMFYLPRTVKAGTTGEVFSGDCVDQTVESVTSEGFVGGEAKIVKYEPGQWRATADIVDKPGNYGVHMKCDGHLGTGAQFFVIP